MLTTLLKLRARLQRLFHFSDEHTMLLWAAVVGLLGALATIGFREGIRGAQWLIARQSGSEVEIAKMLPWTLRLLLPAAGGVLAGLFLLLARHFATRTASDYMEAIAIGDGHISVRQSLLRSLSSLATVASGGSIGREGSMVQLAALAASYVGRMIHIDPPRLRLLVACGAAAGLTSAYNAPIAGAFFVTEIVLGSIAMESFGPLLVASVVANITMREFPGYRPTYLMPAFPPIFGIEVLCFIGLGLLCGVASPQFLRLLDFAKRSFARLGWPLPVRLGLGGLLVGLISIEVPQVWGNGYSVVNSLLHTPWSWSAVLLLLGAKVLATAGTTGSGAIGGVFTPTLFVGAAIGYLVGAGAHALFPVATSPPFAYAMVGMGAFLAAATSAPLMAILMIFEMTLSYQVVLPLMLACVVAYFVARAIDDTSMYEITIRRNRAAKAVLRLRGTRMRDLVKPAETVLPLDAGFEQLSKMFLEYPVKHVFIVDERNRLQGVVALQDVTSALLDPHDTHTRRAADLLRRGSVPQLVPGMSLAEAMQHFLTYPGERLPIVSDPDAPALLGVVWKSSLLDAYFRMHEPDDRAAAAH